MSTTVQLKVWASGSRYQVETCLNRVQEEFFRIANTYTRFNPNSELSTLNKQSGKPASVSPEMLSLVETMLELARFSRGKYDPTIIDLLEYHGYKSSFSPAQIVTVQKQLVNPASYVKKRPSWQQIELKRQQFKVKLAAGQRLDLGGIGKGYALEQAAAILNDVSQDYLISAGGDIYGRGFNQAKGQWTAELRLAENETLGLVELAPAGQALASSGSWARSAGKFHHLLDPDTGAPSQTSLQSFILHPSATLADGLATVLFLCGPSYLDQINSKYQAEALLVTKDKQLWSTNHFPVS